METRTVAGWDLFHSWRHERGQGWNYSIREEMNVGFRFGIANPEQQGNPEQRGVRDWKSRTTRKNIPFQPNSNFHNKHEFRILEFYYFHPPITQNPIQFLDDFLEHDKTLVLLFFIGLKPECGTLCFSKSKPSTRSQTNF